jgi:endonuclease/exonuclease/phosphatase (EEP) superfamily protein YafD
LVFYREISVWEEGLLYQDAYRLFYVLFTELLLAIQQDFLMLLVKLVECKKPVLMLGDFNFDLLTLNSNVNTEFLQNILSSGFLPSISLPTRVTTATATLLDNIFFSTHSLRAVKLSVILSDHFPVSALFDVAQNSPDRQSLQERIKIHR